MNIFNHRLLKIISSLFIGISLLTSQTVQADEIKQIMMQMKKEYRHAMQSSTTDEMAQHIQLLKSYVSQAVHLTHDGSTTEQAIYRQGMQELLASYNELELMLKAGSLAQAKTMLETIRDIQKNYHKKLGV